MTPVVRIDSELMPTIVFNQVEKLAFFSSRSRKMKVNMHMMMTRMIPKIEVSMGESRRTSPNLLSWG